MTLGMSFPKRGRYLDLCHHSTIHGLPHILRADTWYSRWFWILCFTWCVVMLAWQSAELTMTFLKREKQTNIVLNFESLPFPAISICSINPYKKHQVMQVGALQSLMSAVNSARQAAQDKVTDEQTGSRRKRNAIRQVEIDRERRESARFTTCYCDVHNENCMETKAARTNRKLCVCVDRFCKYCPSTDISLCEPPTIPPSTTTTSTTTTTTTTTTTPTTTTTTTPTTTTSTTTPTTSTSTTTPSTTTSTSTTSTSTSTSTTTSTSSSTSTSTLTTSTTTPTTTSTTTKKTATIAPQFKFAMEGGDQIAVQAKAEQAIPYIANSLDQETKDVISFKKADVIKNCAFDTITCDLDSDVLTFGDPKYGKCFTFNHNEDRPKKSATAGPVNGLQIIVFTNISEYLTTTKTLGARMVIHDQRYYPFPDTFGYNVPVASAVAFGVRRKSNIRLKAPYGDCFDESQSGYEKNVSHFYPRSYTIEACQRSCHQLKTISLCKCGNPNLKLPPGNYSSCPYSDEEARECIGRVSRMDRNELNCICPVPCNETYYEVTISTSNWRVTEFATSACPYGDKSCVELWEKSSLLIEVFYEQLTAQLFIETPSYSEFSLIADIAGQVGFWMGTSVISFIELFIICFNCCRMCVMSKVKGNKAEDIAITHNDLPKSVVPPVAKVSPLPKIKSRDTRSTIVSSGWDFSQDSNESFKTFSDGRSSSFVVQIDN